MSSERNQPCRCGSGKKYKKCCLNKKPRTPYVYVGHSEPFQGVSWKDGTALVHLLSGEKAPADIVQSRIEYKRNNRNGFFDNKVVSSVENVVSLIGGIDLLAQKFDVIWAIDTNTKKLEENIISVSSVIKCYLSDVSPNAELNVIYKKHGNMIFTNCPQNEAEKYALIELINIIRSESTYREDQKIGIVTDHDLGNHHAYNTRKQPIYKENYLPNNFQLLYASSDVGKNNLLNRLIIECDRDATILLQGYEKEGKLSIEGPILHYDDSPRYSI